MPKEPLNDVTHLDMKQDVTKQQDVTSLTPDTRVTNTSRKPMTRPKKQPIVLSTRQERLLEKIKQRPEVMGLLQVIFQKYPGLVNREMRLNSPHVTARQRTKGREVTAERLRMEAWIEAQICTIAGINVDDVPETPETPETPEMTQEQVVEAVAIESEPVKKKVTRKKAKKKTKKKVTKKTSKKTSE